jgi:hypothetical protein
MDELCMQKLLQLGNSCFSDLQMQEILAQLKLTNSNQLDLNKLYDQIMLNPVDSGFPPSVLYNLQMSFRPILTHNDLLTESDILNLMTRYCFWIKNMSLFTVHLFDNQSFQNLSQNWNTFRFHIGFRNMVGSWSCVLIDREYKTFEFYDPNFTAPSLLEDVHSLHEFIVKNLLPDIETKTLQLIQRGFQETSAKSCAFLVLRFIHSRIVENKPFDDQESVKCETLKRIFFKIIETRFVSNCSPIDSVYQVSMLDFSGLLDYLVKINDELIIKQEIRELEVELYKFTNSPTKLSQFAVSIQERLINILSEPLIEFIGTDIWQRIVEENCNDPFPLYLMKQNKVARFEIMMEFYKEMEINAKSFIRDIFPTYQKFNPKITNVKEFLKWSSSQKILVYFASHFLREINNWLLKNKYPESNLNQQFLYNSNLVKPIHLTNLYEIQSIVSKCDGIIQEASNILHDRIQDLILEPTLIDFNKIQNIIQYNETDIKNQVFLVKLVQGWNFPISNTCDLLSTLEPRFNVYSCTQEELKSLLESEMFKVYYTIGIWIAKYQMSKDTLIDPIQTVRIILQSLYDFIPLSTDLNHSILCCLLHEMGEDKFDCDLKQSQLDSYNFFQSTRTFYQDLIKNF